MMRSLVLIIATLSLVGCSKKPDIPETKCLVFITKNNHKVTTWVNDEPVLVCDNVWNGYNQAFWMTLRKGDNVVYFSAERLPQAELATKTKTVLEADGKTTVKLVDAKHPFDIFMHPENVKDLIVWTATEEHQNSPRWTVQSPVGFRPSLDEYDTIESIDKATKDDVETFLKKLQLALDEKHLSMVGAKESDFDDFLKEVGLSATCSDVYSAKPYKATVSSASDLVLVHGRKTIMAYRRDGEAVFSAGLSPDAARSDEHKGKAIYYLSSAALFFVKDKGTLKPLWEQVIK